MLLLLTQRLHILLLSRLIFEEGVGLGKFLDVGKKGVHFQDVAEKVAREYMKKGYSKKEAEKIGRKVAGKIFWHKFGKKRGRKIIAKAKRIAKRSKSGRKNKKR